MTISSTIKFNATTGSDTQASGCGPATAVYGSGAETDGTGTVDVSMDGVGLSSVSVGDLLFCDVASGRKFAVITSIDTINETITCGDSFVAESGVSWAVGGKRATFENTASRNLFNESSFVTSTDPTYLVAELETDQTINSTLFRSASGVAGKTSFTFLSKNGSALISNGDFSTVTNGQQVSVWYVGLKFLCTFSGTRTMPAVQGGIAYAYDCEFGEDGGANNFVDGMRSSNYGGLATLTRCNLYGTGTSSGTAASSAYYASGSITMTDCFVKNFFRGVGTAETSLYIRTTIFTDLNNACYSGRRAQSFRNCIFHNIADYAIGFTNTSNYLVDLSYGMINFEFNIAVSVAGFLIKNDFHGTHALEATALGSLDVMKSDWFTYNCPNKVSGNASINETTLTADPFIDAANGDFNLNASAGGGAVLRSTSYTLGG